MHWTTLSQFGILLLSFRACSANDKENLQMRQCTCKIGVVDMNSGAGHPSQCNTHHAESFHTLPGNNESKLSTVTGSGGHESLVYSQHAAPFWLGQAIQASTCYTPDNEEADSIFVNDYCLVISSLALLSSRNMSGYDSVMIELGLAYEELARTRRFQKSSGTDFVFFSPHPYAGASGHPEMACKTFGRALHIVADSAQRFVCPELGARSKFIVAPYSSAHFVEDRAIMENQANRDILIYFQGTCAVNEYKGHYGMRMRAHVVNGIRLLNISGVSVACKSDRPAIPHKELRNELRRSRFCIVLPGDTLSSRRLTEVMLSGCIPVFFGPPWHETPFSANIYYPLFSVIFHLETFMHLDEQYGPLDASYGNEDKDSIEARTEILGGYQWTKHSIANGTEVQDESFEEAVKTTQNLPQNSQRYFYLGRWITHADIEKNALRVRSVAQAMKVLINMPDSQIEELQEQGAKVQAFFDYRNPLGPNDNVEHMGAGTASGVIMRHICERASGTV